MKGGALKFLVFDHSSPTEEAVSTRHILELFIY